MSDLERSAAAFGLVLAPEDLAPPPPDTVNVWPEHAEAFQLFGRCWHQFALGPGGIVGIDYCRLESTMNMLRVPRRKRAELLSLVSVMEAEMVHALKPPPPSPRRTVH